MQPICRYGDLSPTHSQKMSSPSSSLRKVKKNPLPTSRSVPFRPAVSQPPPHTSYDGDLDSATQRHIVQGIRHHGSRSDAASNRHMKAPSDSELLGSMATRLALVEQELLVAKQEVVEKNQYIQRLEGRVAVLEGKEEGGGGSRSLRLKCLALQRQVEEMEEFLNDYGMVWVGSEGEPGRQEGEKEEEERANREEGLWIPQTSLAGAPSFQVDFNLILKNVKELNTLAGEGSASVEKTLGGATLKPVQPIPLTLYENGVVMFQGPFRPYTDPSTQQCVMDLMDGYFPSELQARFPDGIPLQVTDHRDVVFRERQYADLFPGAGHQLGGWQGPSKLVPSSIQLRAREETYELPGPKVSLDTFLSRLPSCVVHGGRVVDIRSGIAETLQQDEGGGGVTLVETPVLQEIRSRLDLTEDLRPPTPSHTTTLRVKSEQAEQTYVLKMKYSDSIGDVRNHINKLRPTRAPRDYQLKSTFPTRTFSDPAATLQDCGLVPRATLLMTRTFS